MLIACRKRRVPLEDIQDAVDRIERDLFQEFDTEVATAAIGERVLRELLEIDSVAYVRFASVYREFETMADFKAIIDKVTREFGLTARSRA